MQQKVAEPPEDLPDVINDFDIEEEFIAIENREEYLNKIERRVKEYQIKVFNEPRPDKKLLVLDIDYTLFGKIYNKLMNVTSIYDIIIVKKYFTVHVYII